MWYNQRSYYNASIISGVQPYFIDVRAHTFIAHHSYCHAGSHVHLFMVGVLEMQNTTSYTKTSVTT